VTLSPNGTISGLDFGNRAPSGSIAGSVWNDLNRNGVFESNEFAMGQITVFLDENGNGSQDTGELSDATDSLGSYSISGVAPGSYTVRLDSSDIAGFIPTIPESGFHVVNVGPGESVSEIDFGNVRAEIRGVVFEDEDGDGTQDPNEFGLSNVTVFLDVNNDGSPGQNDPRTLTDSSGAYVFQNLDDGPYNVRQVVPQGFIQTAPVGDGAHHVTLAAGEIRAGLDFGDEPPSPEGETLSPFLLPEDVDRNGRVDMLDLLTVVNRLRNDQAAPTLARLAAATVREDVNGDERVGMDDLLRVVQHLRDQLGQPAEGETESPAVAPSSVEVRPLFSPRSADAWEAALDDVAADISRRR
jgi:hypothetical protein